ncbi:MAG: hypothetical protein M0C28_36285 [Candidatus Moduliflexus flocculans]|nr:hypothetical protein [Candidatus Moduliflexus flocculans]
MGFAVLVEHRVQIDFLDTFSVKAILAKFSLEQFLRFSVTTNMPFVLGILFTRGALL